MTRRFEIWRASKVDSTPPEVYGSLTSPRLNGHPKSLSGMVGWRKLGFGSIDLRADSKGGGCLLLLFWYVISLVSLE